MTKKTYILSKYNSNLDSEKTYRIAEFFEKNKDIITSLSKISKNLTDKEILDLLRKKETFHLIPISIFGAELGPLESLVKHLKDNLALSFHEIASALNRDDRTIWYTYHNSSKKKTTIDQNSKIKIPLKVFSERKLSILEHLCLHLKYSGLKLNQISALLKKHPSTVWTAYKRAKTKTKTKR